MGNIFKQPCDEGTIRGRAAAAPCARSAGPWILTATILGSSIAFIDGTVVNVALPALQSSLQATAVDMQWVVEAYALFLASLLLVGGSLGDQFGRRIIYAIGVGTFAIASAWCGLAPGVEQLIVARAIQGIGGALLVPGSLAIISASFDEKNRGRAIGTWSGFTSITAAVGPVVGGWLIEHVSWRAAFFINLPIAAIVLVLVFWRVPESRDQRAGGVDWIGAILGTAGLGGLVYGLIESSNVGFGSGRVVSALVIGTLMIALFLIYEHRVKNPLLPPALFRSRNFTGANILTFLLYAGLSGALFFFPLNLIQVQGYSATKAGAALLPFVLIMFLLSPWSGGLVNRYGAKLPLIVGPVLASAGFILFAAPGISDSYWISFFPAVTMLGLGMAIAVAPLTTTVMSSVEQSKAGIASGVNNAVSRTAGVLAVAVFGVIMLHTFSRNLDSGLGNLSLPEESLRAIQDQRIRLAGIELPASLDPQLKSDLDRTIDASFVSGFRLVMIVAAALALGSAVTSALLIEGKSLRTAPAENKHTDQAVA